MTRPRSAGLRRDVDLLAALAGNEARTAGLGVARLAEVTGRAPSQVSRALVALVAEGLVERDDTSRRFALGWRLYALAAETTEARLVRTAGPALVALAQRTGHGAHLCRLHGTSVATLLSAPGGGGPPRVSFDLEDVPVATTSTGRVLLSERDPATARPALLAAGVDPEVLDRVRADGHAIVDGEYRAHLAGAAAPVRDFHGGTVAALTVSGPAREIRPHLPAIAAATRTAAAELSVRLGAPRP